MNKEKIKFDHFKDVEELIKHLEMWYAEDDYDAYDRFFGLRDARIMGMIIYELNNDIKTLLKENEAKEKVIKKQDYVINELEKWLKEYADKDTMSSIIFGVVLNHLIDLKGENNEKD